MKCLHDNITMNDNKSVALGEGMFNVAICRHLIQIQETKQPSLPDQKLLNQKHGITFVKN